MSGVVQSTPTRQQASVNTAGQSTLKERASGSQPQWKGKRHQGNMHALYAAKARQVVNIS
eukprot:1898115-Prorocentrum_lima.AAC.1